MFSLGRTGNWNLANSWHLAVVQGCSSPCILLCSLLLCIVSLPYLAWLWSLLCNYQWQGIVHSVFTWRWYRVTSPCILFTHQSEPAPTGLTLAPHTSPSHRCVSHPLLGSWLLLVACPCSASWNCWRGGKLETPCMYVKIVIILVAFYTLLCNDLTWFLSNLKFPSIRSEAYSGHFWDI